MTDTVAAGRIGTRPGGGFYELGADQPQEPIAYRDRACVAMAKLLEELGPSPLATAQPYRPDVLDVPDEHAR